MLNLLAWYVKENTIQQHSTLFNRVAKHVQQVYFINVERVLNRDEELLYRPRFYIVQQICSQQ